MRNLNFGKYTMVDRTEPKHVADQRCSCGRRMKPAGKDMWRCMGCNLADRNCTCQPLSIR